MSEAAADACATLGICEGSAIRDLPSMGERGSLHWVIGETTILCRCWANVSQEYGWPGTSQSSRHLWNKITERYHSLNPPIPTDKNGNPAPRQKSALMNKWKRMGPFISSFIKNVAFALANHKSGESATDGMRRSVDLNDV